MAMKSPPGDESPPGRVPEAISRIPRDGDRGALWKVFRIVALGTGGFATEAICRRKGRNPSKEIFSELDEINAQGPIFARSFQKTERKRKWGHEVVHTRAARPSRGAWCGPLVTPSDLPFRRLKASVAKPPVPRAMIRKTLLRGRRRQSHLRDSGDRPALPERGIITRGALHHHARLRIDA
ncbi:hypothetical protein QYE76_053189 [Lolium multiflorum]|uniref:Uncharacterized protein n=1 Tax=Lolium multiflorum TaxID=4521 RepID=A0AAD8SW63_LOLMU|nr:hypothetical protein QYE76_053189 [Lolium multiflorum]